MTPSLLHSSQRKQRDAWGHHTDAFITAQTYNFISYFFYSFFFFSSKFHENIGVNTFLRNLCSDHKNIQETSGEICNINLHQLCIILQWKLNCFKMKTLRHSYFMVWYFITTFLNRCIYTFKHWFSTPSSIFICITIDRQSNLFSHVSHRSVGIRFILNKHGTKFNLIR